jgi:hypothetical protein
MWWLDYQLNESGVRVSGLYDKPQRWCDVTWGLVKGFKVWILQQGYTSASIPICPCDISKPHHCQRRNCPNQRSVTHEPTDPQNYQDDFRLYSGGGAWIDITSDCPVAVKPA